MTTDITHSAERAAAEAEAAAHERKISPRADLWQSLGWIALGIATTIGALRMDRLERQDINPYTVPGLLPGLLGAAIVFFGLLMLYRSWRRLAKAPHVPHARTEEDRAEMRRMWTVLALCIGFAGGLVGHGLPFWLAAAVFVTVTISLLQFAERAAKKQRLRGLAFALAVGLGAGVIITLVFQEFFLVRLP
ncbi:tripartite tricarboxylate transporter TctB family protein [Variovorax paradoxus]|nr:tripartite tricarboxylate transporter TctB family protein [Variovorax paradoxus]MBT2299695.1 tripartite tricarboxylate transporter TctB family protein [Variovorax paradoxus]